MSEKLIPEYIDPFRYADQKLHLDGTVSLKEMKRLNTSLHFSADKISADLQFGTDEQGTTFLKGHVKTMLTLQCQRCLEPFSYEIMSHFVLGIVTTLDAANALSSQYEPALAKNGELALRELIEDEIILNLPIIPRHEPEDCSVKLPVLEVESEAHKKANPFQKLQSLKDKKL